MMRTGDVRDRVHSGGGAALAVEGLTLRYGAARVLDGVSFTIASGSIVCLLGPSGSGKSSALRLIAGLERATAGTITIDGEVVAAGDRFVEPEHRHVGMVFQDFALFPHLTVEANVAFGLRKRKQSETATTVRELLADVGLLDRARSYPHMLSGGERQRVALARALAPKPRVLVMDEPFSSLDVLLRNQLRDQTLDLLRRRGTTAILVTHDPHEALRVADYIGVLSSGRLAQFGPPADLYGRPCSPQMACAFGAVNSIQGTIESGLLFTPIGVFSAPTNVAAGPATVCIRPENLTLQTGGTGAQVVVSRLTCVGDAAEVQLRLDDVRLVARVPAPTSFDVGDAPHLSVDPSHLLIFPQHGALAPTAA